ncbi:MAG: GtrA family protein [Pseudomonadota bacterium]
MRATALRLAWFGAIGVLATAVHYAAVVALVRGAGWAPIPANVVAWLLAFVCSFAGHSRRTFSDSAVPARIAARRFFAISALGFVANQAGYAMLLQMTAVRYDVAVPIVALGVAAMTYVLSRQWAFRPGAALSAGWLPRSWPVRGVLALHAIGVLLLAFHAWTHPLGNWDIVPYTALVRAQPGMTAQQVADATFRDVRAYMGEAHYVDLIEGGPPVRAYRMAIHTDPEALRDTLRFYSIKPLYIGLARWASQFTGSGASAGVLVSAAALALLFSVLPLFFARPLLAVGAVWLLLLPGGTPLWLIAACATPDTLGMLLVVLCALTGLRSAHWAAVGALGVLAVLARPDAAFMVVPILLGLAWLRRASGQAVLFALSAAACFALFAFLGTRALPWSTLFWHTFMETSTYPSRIAQHVGVAEYFAVLRRTAHALLEPRPLIFLVLGAALSLIPFVRGRTIAPWQGLAGIATGGMLLHFLVFPIDEFGHERMFLASYVLLAAAALLAWESRDSGKRQAPLEPAP